MFILEQCEQIRNSLVSDISSCLTSLQPQDGEKILQRWSATKKDLLINEDEQRGGIISQIQISAEWTFSKHSKDILLPCYSG